MEKITYYIRQILASVSRGLIAYLKASAKIAILSFVLLAVGLLLIGVDYWALKALGIAIVDIIPVLGSGIIMIPWAVVHFFLGNTTMAWQIGLLYVGVVVFRQFAEPIITGKSIGVRPLYTFLATVICMVLFGPLGAVLGAVAAIVIKSIMEVKAYREREPYDENPFY